VMRRDALLAAIGSLSLLLSAWTIRETQLASTNSTIAAGECQVPATIIEPPGQVTGRAAIVIHGLSANRRVMRLLGETLAREDNLRAYLIDLPGHGDNTDTFSFPHAEECARAVVERLARDGTITPAQTALVGHSMGGEIAIRLADHEPAAATVAISPAPMILPRRMPSNLLVFSAQYDLPQLRQEARILARAAGGNRTTPDDFPQQRAFHLENVPWVNHTSIVVDPYVAEQAAEWIAAAFDSTALEKASAAAWTDQIRWLPAGAGSGWHTKTSLLRAWTVRIAPMIGFAGFLLMFPFATRVASTSRECAEVNLKEGGVPPAPQRLPKQPLILAEGAAFAFVATLVLKIGVPLKFLHLYSGAYLASLLAIFGLLLLASNLQAAEFWWICDLRALLSSLALGLAVMLACGAWLNWRLGDLWLDEARWWRFAALMPFCFVFSFAEEVVLGPVGRAKRRFSRFFVFALLRLELWLAAVVAFYAWGSGNVLIGVLAPALAAFSVLQRLGTDQIRTRSGSPVAGAVFGAILAAWLIAAIFPLT
jgi:pimeloyl-ACP methyl ester carboxylesterase